MSTNCEHCGYRDNEVKSGTAVSEKGKRITLRCEDREDLSRDILKVGSQKIICAISDDSKYLQSETAGLTVPEIDLVLTQGTLGGRFTTVEGILVQIYEELGEKTFLAGDSAIGEAETNKLNQFLSELKKVGILMRLANATRSCIFILFYRLNKQNDHSRLFSMILWQILTSRISMHQTRIRI